MSEYTIRKASCKDIEFLLEVIVEAEKGGTDRWGFPSMLNLAEQQARIYLKQMLEEDIDGCEYSISNFYIASKNDKNVAAVGGWIEGENEDKLPSAIIKSNLYSFILPLEQIQYMAQHFSEAQKLQIKRKLQTLQIEYVYVKPEHRGKQLAQKLIARQIEEAKQVRPDLKEAYIQLFKSNSRATAAYQQMGFSIHRTSMANTPAITAYFPDIVKIEMKKNI